MSRRSPAIALLLLAVACSTGPLTDDPGDGSWQGTITTEGGVTTVVNESGSVWGGEPRWVEEASIGVDAGDDPYMFGDVQSLAVDDQRIYVLDRQVPVVRVFDLSGQHLFDAGRAGQGPGEFESPAFLGIDADGGIYVQDGRETEVFTPSGERAETLATASAHRPGPQAPEIAVGPLGEIFMPRSIGRDEQEPLREDVDVAEYRGSEEISARPLPDLGHEPMRIVATFRGAGFESISAIPPPFSAELVWTIGAGGEIVVGRADRYEIERHAPDGSLLRFSRAVAPTPVEPDERAWHERRIRSFLQRAAELRGYDIDAGLPPTKPAFWRIFIGATGRVWVLRPSGSQRIQPCNEAATSPAEFSDDPCWRDVFSLDVFDTDGRFLGSAPVPPGASFIDPEEPRPAIRGDTLVAVVEDAAGTIMVKRHRLVLPGEE